MQKTILLVWQHGHEMLAPRVRVHINKHRPELWDRVDFINGNPRAARLSLNHVETNLNRSYSPPDGIARSYEEKRAKYILQRIRQGSYQYVLDLHTTVTDSGRLWIARSLSDAVRAVIGQSDIERVAIMNAPALLKTSLMGQFPFVAALEYNEHLARQPAAVAEVIQVIDGLLACAPAKMMAREVYLIDQLIPNEPALEHHDNFIWSTVAGGYPILHGNNIYRENGYQGFRAISKRTEIL
jgi:Succinylglutamate desuccinylase / Aspartoacylase family